MVRRRRATGGGHHVAIARDLFTEPGKGFLGERLQREANHAVAQLELEQDQTAVPTALDSVSQGYQVFHHLYVLRFNGLVSASDPQWQQQLAPLLDESGDA